KTQRVWILNSTLNFKKSKKSFPVWYKFLFVPVLLYIIEFPALSETTFAQSDLKSIGRKKLTKSSSLFLSENQKLVKQLTKAFKNRTPSRKTIFNYLIKKHYFKTKILHTEEGWKIENPVKTIFSVKGSKFFDHQEINKIIHIDETKLGINLYKSAVNSLRTAYSKQGFQKVKISYNIKRKQWREWVYLKVKEGPRIQIEEINVTGLLSQPPEVYMKLIKNNSTPLIQEGYYNKADLEKGYDNLIKHLRGQGYLQSRLYSDRVIYKDNKVIVTVNLEEGPRSFIKTIELKGNKYISSGEILSSIQSRVQSPLLLTVLEEDLNLIEKIYKNRGFLNIKTQRKEIIEYGENSQYVTIKLVITEGKQVIIDRITIQGFVNARKDLIKNLLTFEEGTLLTPKKIETSISALSALNLFSQVSIEQNKDNPSEIMVSVKEKNLQDVRGGVGVNTQRTLTARAYGEYRHKNLFGYGRNFFGRISSQVNLFRPVLEYEVSGIYQEVFIPGKNIKGNIGLSRSHNIFSYTENINAVKRDQVSFSIDTKLTPYLKSNFKLWDLEARKELCLDNPNCPEPLRRIGSSHISIQYDKRNSIFNPTKGFFFSVKAEYSSPLIGSSPDIQFWKFNFSNQIYHSLSDYVFAIGLKGGLIFSNRSIPVSHAFILGGQSSLRGYDGNIEGERIPNSTLAPIKTANEPLTLKIKESAYKATSSQYALAKLEFRFPLTKTFKGLIFYDAGLVRLTANGHSRNDYGHSAGVGFRYETIVPFGVDFAYKLPLPPHLSSLPRPSSLSQYRFHIAIGLF
ncbi:MAG: BamA/TamA family outer membrane protein, partial [Bdellovibrionales bacterium]|nr:BamA/TamA family outer membrane protein [Bdellovibrionales bacterium]